MAVLLNVLKSRLTHCNGKQCQFNKYGNSVNMQKIGSYFSVFKLLFTFRASARAVAPSDPVSLLLRLWKRRHVSRLAYCKTQIGLRNGLILRTHRN